MSAADNLHPVQFQGKADTSDSDRDKASAYDSLGADTDASFGFSADDPADYLYERQGKEKTETSPKGDVF